MVLPHRRSPTHPFYYLARRYPRTLWRHVNIPIMMYVPNVVPPMNGINFTSWAPVGFIFQLVHEALPLPLVAYPLAAGLDAGVIIGLFVIFFSLQMRSNGRTKVNWWGNSLWKNTADAQLTPLKVLAPGEDLDRARGCDIPHIVPLL